MAQSTNQKEYWSSFHSVKASYKAMMYYEGTPCPMILTSVDEVKLFETGAEEMIIVGLKTGNSIKDQIALYSGQNGNLHTKLEISQLKYGVPQAGTLNLDELKLWWLNCFALLRLKAIKSDDNYGLLIFQC